MKFLQKKRWCSRLHVRSTIDRFSESLTLWLMDLIRQSDINIVWEVASYVALDKLCTN